MREYMQRYFRQYMQDTCGSTCKDTFGNACMDTCGSTCTDAFGNICTDTCGCTFTKMREHFGRMQRHSRFALLIPPDEKRQKFVNLHKKFALFGLYCSIFSNRFNLEPVCCIIADRIINDLRKIIATIKAAIKASIEAAIEAQKSKNLKDACRPAAERSDP